jgi:hypothetical protein
MLHFMVQLIGILLMASVAHIPWIYKKWVSAPKKWKLLTAEILQSEVCSIDTYVEGVEKPIPGLLYCINVGYEYKVDEETFKGHSKFAESVAGREIELNTALYQVGSTVQIFYNVDNPKISVGTWPDRGTSEMKANLSIVLFLFVIGLLMFLG